MAKNLKSITPFILNAKAKKAKFCVTCGNLATHEACFEAGEGVTVIEKYCDACVKKIK